MQPVYKKPSTHEQDRWHITKSTTAVHEITVFISSVCINISEIFKSVNLYRAQGRVMEGNNQKLKKKRKKKMYFMLACYFLLYFVII